METPELPDKVLEKLNSKRSQERERAEEALSALGPEAVDALIEVMERESRNRRRRRNIGIAVIVGYLVLIIVVSATSREHSFGSAFSGLWGSIATLFAVSQLQKNAARALARYDDIRGVGFLAEALEYDDKGVVDQAREALIRLLPKLRASNHGLLTHQQRRCLDRALLKNKSAALSLAILNAYEQVGDETSVAVVEKIAAGQVRRLNEQRFVRKAQEVLPALRERAEMVRAAQTLLRPAEAVGEDTLLRPASGPSSTATETLVRPAGETDSAEDAAAPTVPAHPSEGSSNAISSTS